MPSRDEVLASIAKLNSAPKQRITQPEESRVPSAAGVTQALGVSRVRDRQLIARETTTAAPVETWEQSVARQRTENERRGAEARERRARDAAERKARIERKRIQKIEDASCLKEAQERRDKQIADNFIRAEIKQIMQDHYDITEEVVALVKSWGNSMMKFPPAWAQAVAEVRAKQTK